MEPAEEENSPMTAQLEPDDPTREADARDVLHNVRDSPQSDGNERILETNVYRRDPEPGGRMSDIVGPRAVDDGRGCRMDGEARCNLKRVETRLLAASRASQREYHNEERAMYPGHPTASHKHPKHPKHNPNPPR